MSRPAVAPPAPWAFPVPAEHRLTNGVRALLHDMPGQHVVSVEVVVELPASAEPRDQEGVATILSRVLDEGTHAHPGDAYADALESVGAAFHAAVGASGLRLMVDVPASRLGAGIDLLAEAVRTPEIRDDDVRRHVALRLAEIEQQRASSATRAGMELREALWDPTDRTHRALAGEPDTVATLTADHARAHHALLGPALTTVVVAGALPEDTLERLERAFGDWAGVLDERPAERLPHPAAPTVRLVDRPGSVQADLRLAGQGIDRLDPRWAAFQVAVHGVGGGFLSRLNARLREDLGWTYGVGLQPSPRRTGGSWSVAGSFRTEVAADAVVEARRLLDIAGSPITGSEVADAVNHLGGTTPLRYATAEGVADQQAANVLNGTPTDHVTRWLAALRDVTPEQATAAYTEIVDLAALTLIVVGDAAAIRPGLVAAGWIAD
ncbi:pitrilysin family protein [Mariniluteicoccus endophyticus]